MAEDMARVGQEGRKLLVVMEVLVAEVQALVVIPLGVLQLKVTLVALLVMVITVALWVLIGRMAAVALAGQVV
jgi:hypothetical protein|tara:strand:+ start:237 stop:455 length:219 start_codon:yes stop_codon:yes gene_type:complete